MPEPKTNPTPSKKPTSEHIGAVIAIIGAAALVLLLILGKAGFDGADTARLTVTRACGSAAFLGVILYLGYRPQMFAGRARAALFILPALAVAVNNLPILPLVTGGARVTADAGEVFAYAVESLFIGLFEELAFRGILLLTVVERFGATRRGLFLSAVVTSAVFGASHLFNLFGGVGVGATLLQVSYSFLIGAMCSLVLLLTGSLSSCVLIHAVYDFGGYLIPRLGEGVVWTAPEIALTAAVGIAAAAFYINACRYLCPESARLLTNPHVAENVTEKQKM